MDEESGAEEEETQGKESAEEEMEGVGEILEEEEVGEAIEEEVEADEEFPPLEEEIETLPGEEVEEEIVEERFYTIPLGKAWIAPAKKRVPRAIGIIKDFVKRHMKLRADEGLMEERNRLIISNEVNEMVWRRGIKKPPRKVRVRVARDMEGNVTVYLAEGD